MAASRCRLGPSPDSFGAFDAQGDRKLVVGIGCDKAKKARRSTPTGGHQRSDADRPFTTQVQSPAKALEFQSQENLP